MLQVKGRPALEYNLECALAAGLREAVIVVGYRAEEIINHFGNRYGDLKISYVIQWEQKGLVHAMECARPELGGADFMLFLGDEIMAGPRHRAMIEEFERTKAFAVCGVLKVEDRERIKKTYTLITDENGVIHRLVEKPQTPFNDLMGTGTCVFRGGIFDYMEFTPIHHMRHEKELPDLVQCAIDDGKTARSFVICDKYTNINSREDLEYAEMILAH